MPDPLEVALELPKLPPQLVRFLVGNPLERAVLDHALEFLHPVDAPLDRIEVGQGPAEPAAIHVVGPAPLRLVGDRGLHLLLRPEEQDLLPLGRAVAHEEVGLLEHLHGLLEVDDVNPLALREDVAGHLGVPLPRPVTEMNSGLQEFLHRQDFHILLPRIRALDWKSIANREGPFNARPSSETAHPKRGELACPPLEEPLYWQAEVP